MQASISSVWAGGLNSSIVTRVAVHLRFGDTHFRHRCGREAADTRSYTAQLAHSLQELAGSFASVPLFLVESDDPCVRAALAITLETRGLRVVPPSAAASHSVLESVSQLAGWFAFSVADVFVLKPFCEDRGKRLSGWSAMAMLRALEQRFYRLCDPLHSSHCATPPKCSILTPNLLLSSGHMQADRLSEEQQDEQRSRWTLGVVEHPLDFEPRRLSEEQQDEQRSRWTLGVVEHPLDFEPRSNASDTQVLGNVPVAKRT
jgi:hypothetical protein